jgi:hypothetical protein
MINLGINFQISPEISRLQHDQECVLKVPNNLYDS